MSYNDMNMYDGREADVLSINHNDSGTCLPQIGNKTVLLYEGYGGVPENLAINAISWFVLLLLFAILRRFAWDYGRIALVSRQEENAVLTGSNRYNVWTSLFYGEHDENKLHGSMESLDTQIHQQDRGFCSWIMAFIRVKDADIQKKCGNDAIQYLSFQRYLLLYMTVICILSTSIIIPVNFTGDNIGNSTDFGHTTIANLDSNSKLLWIHAVLSVVYLVLAVVFMRHFSNNLQFDDDESVTKTLMIRHIPKDRCYRSVITQHFSEGYPEVMIEDIQFAYNVTELMALDTKRAVAAEARLNSEQELRKTGHRPTLRPYRCGQCLCCGDQCGCREVDAINYYSEEEMKFKDLFEKEKVTAYKDALGIAFVTFEAEAMAERVMTDFRMSCKGSHNPQPSSIHNELDITEWEVMYAPSPDNIYWARLSEKPAIRLLKKIVFNFILIFVLFFLTTPTIIISTLDQFHYKIAVEKIHSPLIVQFFPTLMLWIFTALIPNIVWYLDQLIGHWTRSSEHHSVMRKIYISLVLMVLILPSLGLTSAKALFEFFIIEKEKNIRWECIFLSGNGAFFVNYIITSAFIGTALELLRFSELFVYGLKLLLAKSSAERTSVRKHVLWEFQYGMQYAWLLCVFATIMAYSISCPLIVPFGLVYMVMKHLVDRYNIYFAYKASHINQHVHTTAINLVIVAVIFLQFNTVFFSVIRGGSVQPMSVFSIVILVLSLIGFFGRVVFGWFKNFGPLRYKQFSEPQESLSADNGITSKPFVAAVLRDDSNNIHQADLPTLPPSSYGAVNARQPGSADDVVIDAN